MYTVVLYLLFNLQSPLISAEILTLEKAQALATNTGLALTISDLDYQLAQAELKIGRSAFFPKLGVEGGYQKFDSDQERISGTYGHLFGEFKFDLGGSDYFRYKAISTDAQIAKIKNDQIRRTNSWTIETKFSEVLYLQEALKLHRWALEQNTKYAQMARRKKESGQASDADIIEFDLGESSLRSDLEEVNAEYTRALGELKASLNLTSEQEIELKGSLAHYHLMEDLEQLRARYQNNNTQLQVANLEIEKMGQQKSSYYSGFLPELALKTTYGRRGMDEPKGPEQTYAVIATWEFFSGFRDAGEFEKASLLVQRAEQERKLLALNAPAQLEAEYKKFLTIQNRVDIEAQNRTRSKRYLETVLGEYRRGIKNSADLRSASLLILEASLKDLKYRYEGIKQKEVLQKTLGDAITFEVSSTEHKIH